MPDDPGLRPEWHGPVRRLDPRATLAARRVVLGRPRRCKLARAFRWEDSCERLKVGPSSGPTRRLAHHRARGIQSLLQVPGTRRDVVVQVDLGFGGTVASELEAPNMLAHCLFDRK